MKPTCNQCGKPIELSAGGGLPPWCPGCGVDLKTCPLQIAPSADTAERSPEDERDWKDRFGMHNMAVGILLFVWGTVVSAGPPQSGGDKVLRSHERLNALIHAVQVGTLLNGIALVASGVALRRGWRWGYPLAVLCGIVLVVAGFIFLAGFQHLDGEPYLEHGVARLSFVRYNLDTLIGLVDGFGLLWFVSTRLPRYGTCWSAANATVPRAFSDCKTNKIS
jgi:hypothetical protein